MRDVREDEREKLNVRWWDDSRSFDAGGSERRIAVKFVSRHYIRETLLSQQHDNLFRALHLQDSKIRRPLLLGNLVASLGVLLVAKELRIHLRGQRKKKRRGQYAIRVVESWGKTSGTAKNRARERVRTPLVDGLPTRFGFLMPVNDKTARTRSVKRLYLDPRRCERGLDAATHLEAMRTHASISLSRRSNTEVDHIMSLSFPPRSPPRPRSRCALARKESRSPSALRPLRVVRLHALRTVAVVLVRLVVSRVVGRLSHTSVLDALG